MKIMWWMNDAKDEKKIYSKISKIYRESLNPEIRNWKNTLKISIKPLCTLLQVNKQYVRPRECNLKQKKVILHTYYNGKSPVYD